MARPARTKNQSKPAINPRERKDLEAALASLPTGPATADDDFSGADALLKFGYHQNPYMRMFTKILWSGYALSRGQVGECDQRFKQAHRDAQMSNIDTVTIGNLDEAASALERSMAPDGSVSEFLTEMRERTLQRIWARVCETSHLPPPSFSQIFGTAGAMTLEEMEAADAAEMEAMMKDNGDEEEDGEDDDEADGEDDRDDEDHSEAAQESKTAAPADAGAPPPLPTAAPERPAAENVDRAPERGRGDGDEPQQPAAFQFEISRSGGADLAGELLLAAAAEALKELRVRGPQGELKFTLQIAGEGKPRRSRRRSRRRRN